MTDWKNELVPAINNFFRGKGKPDKHFVFVILVCEANETMVEGDTRVFSNMDMLSAVHLLQEATKRIPGGNA